MCRYYRFLDKGNEQTDNTSVDKTYTETPSKFIFLYHMFMLNHRG